MYGKPNPSDKASDAPTPSVVGGVIAEFDSDVALVAAARSVKEAGYRTFDCFSPYPIHGIDPAMGVRPTILPWLVLGAGFVGCVVAMALQWYANAFAYPLIVSGKPFFSVPANIPVAFELIVLFAAFTAFLGALALNDLPRFFCQFWSAKKVDFGRSTTDGFFLTVDADNGGFQVDQARQTLLESGAATVDVYFRPPPPPAIPSTLVWGGVIVALLALVPPLLTAKMQFRNKAHPYVHWVLDMDFQPKYEPQAYSPYFIDGQTSRPRPEGVVYRTRERSQGGYAATEMFAGYAPDPNAAPLGGGGILRDEQGLPITEETVAARHYLEGLILAKNDAGLPKRDDAGRLEWIPASSYPIAITDEAMARGQQRFEIYCSACHGLSGDGKGPITLRALELKAPLWSMRAVNDTYVSDQAAGQIFATITHGVVRGGMQIMPGYASQIAPEDRWKIILYLRALQRSQNATLDDVPPERRSVLK